MPAKHYPIEIENVGEDTYCVISRGHHDIHEFMRAVREYGYDWPLGVPVHIWMKTTPPPRNSGYSAWYSPVPEGTRGAWPCTYASEAYGEDAYVPLTESKEAANG